MLAGWLMYGLCWTTLLRGNIRGMRGVYGEMERSLGSAFDFGMRLEINTLF